MKILIFFERVLYLETSMETMYIPLSSIFIAFIINFLITPIIIRVAHKLRWYDKLNSRKIHTGLIPRLGGVGIFVSLIITCCMVSFIAFLNSGKTMPYLIAPRYLFLLAGISIIHLIGLVDDFVSQKPMVKLLVQIIAASCVVCGGFVVRCFLCSESHAY